MKERYERYRDSGVPWIGQVPAGWEVMKLRKYLRLCSERGHQDEQLLSVTREQGVIIRNTESKEENHNFIPADLSNYKYVRAGQFAINKMKAWQGSYGVSPYNGIVSPAYYVCDLANIDPHFFSIAIRSRAYVPFFSQLSKGIRVDQWDLSTDALKSVPFIEPPLPIQRAIAGYLDARCAAIDAYVASLEREAGLARELKQAVIARAVTRGLDPNAPMRDSGIPWIGQVPQGWELVRTKTLFKSVKRIVGNDVDKYERLALTMKGVIKRSKDDGEGLQPEKFETYQILKENELVFKLIDLQNVRTSRVGISPYIGLVSPVYIILTNDNPDNRYFYYWFMSMYYRNVFNYLGSNGVRSALNASDLLNIKIPLPPLHEQRAIAGYLDARCAAIDAYVASLEREATLARELKQREIADAVTGKVKITA